MNKIKSKNKSDFLNGQINVNNENKVQFTKNIALPNVRKSSYRETGDINYGNIIHQEIDTNNSIRYSIDKKDTRIIEYLSRWLVRKYGENNLKISGIISGTLGSIAALDAFFSTTYLFSWLPKFPGSNGTLLLFGIALIFAGSFLFRIVGYKYESRCNDCKEFYSLEEIEEPEVIEIEAHDGVRLTINRKYKCRNCGYIQAKKIKRFIKKE